MKKLLSLLGICVLSITVSGCVNEGTSVTLIGVSYPGDCTAGHGTTSIIEGTLDPGYDVYHANLNIINNMTEASAWSSGSSSSTGSTFEPTLPAMNAVYLDKVIITCGKIDGSADNCQGKDDLETSLHSMQVLASGESLVTASIDLSEWNFSKSAEVNLQIQYHDSGVFSDKSNTISFIISRSTGITYEEFTGQCEKFTAVTRCARYGQDSPADENVWNCEKKE